LDSLRDFFRITSRTVHPEEAFRQITAHTFGTAMPYLSVSVAGLKPDIGKAEKGQGIQRYWPVLNKPGCAPLLKNF
jgi:hypothetical protein